MGRLIEGRFGIGVGTRKYLEEVFGGSYEGDTSIDEAYGQLIRFINERMLKRRLPDLEELTRIEELRNLRKSRVTKLSE